MEQLKTYGPSVAGALGTALTAKGDISAGNAAARAADYQARQMEVNAGQENAVASFSAQEEQRKTDLLASKAIAVAAASGGGTLDPTVVKILQGIHGEGALAKQMQIYNGAEAARGLRDQAKATRYEGKLTKGAYKKRALSTILTGVNKLANTWGSDPAPRGTSDTPDTDVNNWGITA